MVGKDGQLDFVTVVLGGARVMFSRAPGGAAPRRSGRQPVEIYLQVEDVEAYHNRVKKNGVKISDPLTLQWRLADSFVAELDMDAARAYLASLDDARGGEVWRIVARGTELFAAPRAAVIRSFLFNHLYHHRGQLLVYLRLLDVPVPSVYGPTADENPFAALPA